VVKTKEHKIKFSRDGNLEIWKSGQAGLTYLEHLECHSIFLSHSVLGQYSSCNQKNSLKDNEAPSSTGKLVQTNHKTYQ
jgi:hypothetical protein